MALDKHFKPNNFGDTFAKYLVKSLRIPTDLFFQVRKEGMNCICSTKLYCIAVYFTVLHDAVQHSTTALYVYCTGQSCTVRAPCHTDSLLDS